MGVLDRVKTMIGLDYEEDDMFEGEDENYEMEDSVITSTNRKNNKVVNIHSQASSKVMLVKPATFEEVVEISDNFKNRKIVLINTTLLDGKQGQRLLDFLSGAAYVLDGDIVKIDEGVYMLSPSNVEVTNELKNEFGSKSFFTRNK